MIQKITCILLLFIVSTFSYGQGTTLNPGDIAITGFNSEDSVVEAGFIGFFGSRTTTENEFSFVLLNDIENGTVIRFTDNGWNDQDNPDTFRTGEGVLIWTADSDFPCGTEITIPTGTGEGWFFGIPFTFDLEPSDGELDISEISNFDLDTNGDQILAYQGTDDNPDFVFGINFNADDWRGRGANSDQTSGQPRGLTDNIDEVSVIEFDNGKYDCTVTLGTGSILESICIAGNWDTQDTPRYDLSDYCDFVCGDCRARVTWDDDGWSNGTGPDATNEVIIASPYNTADDGDITACSITINTGVTLTVENTTYIEIEHDAIVNGDLTIETQGNFVQRGEGSDAGSFIGSGTVNKTTPSKADWYYYTYWSSPVVGATIDDVFPLVDGDSRYYFEAINFRDSDGDDVDDNGDDWNFAFGSSTMETGVGYAVTGIKSSTYPAVDNVTFFGEFNTGDETVDIFVNGGNPNVKWNFIGNPYPSAIDFDLFAAANSAVVEGVAYFWSQFRPPLASNPGNSKLNLNQADYAVYNFSGGVGTEPGGAGVTPNGFIPSGQGFFIPAITTGTATFTNTMRMATATSNEQFFKIASTKKSAATNTIANKLWVNLTSNNGVFNQTLIAYVDGATDGKDPMAYDAPKVFNPGFAAALYSIMENDSGKYIIQGKEPNSINEDDVIKLGFSTTITVPTEFKLSIDHLQGDFLNSNAIYIKDNALNTIHNLTDSDYSFTSEVGEFNERFEIIFKEEAALSLDENNVENNTLRIVSLYGDAFLFKTSDHLSIKTVAIFDLLGRQLYDLKGTKSAETYSLSNLSKATYVVRVQLSNGAVITKKIIKN
ncbi:T9SS sorting signal type C domain-containing protein [Algibacter mikhailovii]|uniref:T9SS type A sorting domain-containing protein n=1 Tax=Algibacter mikhailovii TaxID=425498 RepID=A0A918R3H7_9FLAO|nr:T9SS sorting signal type C domain-containing protein [Algibacter mikhailovii]GGZ84420.1 hypothetical protein GCM10007028_22940 [Algibacter mikhailovii]